MVQFILDTRLIRRVEVVRHQLRSGGKSFEIAGSAKWVDQGTVQRPSGL
jgi:hypothetical protein